MPVPVHRRSFDLFLSHAHTDRALVQRLYSWLTESAGLAVWYDATQMSGGEPIASGLHRGIEQCRGMLLIASEAALRSGWVEDEYNVAKDEQALSTDFRLIPLRVGGADAGTLIRGQSWIELPQPELTPAAALAILLGLYPGGRAPEPATSRDIYVSASWRPGDQGSAVAVGKKLVEAGFRLIGDAKDQDGFGDDRVARIIESCGALAAVIPYRGQEQADAADSPYRYFLREIDLARASGLPCLVVADPRVRRTDGDDHDWFRLETDADGCPAALVDRIDALWEAWRRPPHPHSIFLALDLESQSAARSGAVRQLLERVTGLPTTIGSEIQGAPLQQRIIDAICGAHLVVADLSGDGADAFNLETCIEAGMARASGTNLRLVARGPTRRPPFMLRDLQMQCYADEVELLGLVHAIARRFRRRVLNAEL